MYLSTETSTEVWGATVSQNLSDMKFQIQETPATLAHSLYVQSGESLRLQEFHLQGLVFWVLLAQLFLISLRILLFSCSISSLIFLPSLPAIIN